MHVNNANKTRIKGPKTDKLGVMKTGGVRDDKTSAALNGPGSWVIQKPA